MNSQHPSLASTDRGVYRFTLEVAEDSEGATHDVPLSRNEFQRAIYATWFEGLRRGLFPDYSPSLDEATILPRFPDDASRQLAARTAGFTVTVSSPEAPEVSQQLQFSTSYFRSRALQFRTALRQAEEVAADSTLHFSLAAYLDDEAPASGDAGSICLGPPTAQLKIKDGNTPETHSCESPAIWGVDETDDKVDEQFPIWIDRLVVGDVLDETRAAPEREVAGFLLGHVRRHPDTGQLFALVTGSVSGSDTTDGDSTSVTYTPETFALGRRMIQLRGEDEMIIGWYHSHPFRFCSECPLPVPRECVEKVLFYSQDDIQLMETTFDQPYMVGLLAAVEPRIEQALGHPPVRLFGWHQGQIKTRRFQVFDAT